MFELEIKPSRRQPDHYGSGYFGASRGSRKHTGVDFACIAGSQILAPVEGEVTKLGYPYGDDLGFRYVQITCLNRMHRMFYVLPTVSVGDKVKVGDKVGLSQTLMERYPNGMTDHVHYEIMFMENGKKKFADPDLYHG